MGFLNELGETEAMVPASVRAGLEDNRLQQDRVVRGEFELLAMDEASGDLVRRLLAAREEIEWLRASIATSGFEVVEVTDTAGRRCPGLLVERGSGG